MENLTSCDESINIYISQESEKNQKLIKEIRDKTRVTAVQYGILGNGNEITYHVVTNDGTEKDLTSKEMRLNYPLELLKFLEKTSFKGS